MKDREDDDICGETIDHDLREIGSADGQTSWECRRCGAEIIEDDEPSGDPERIEP